MVNQLPPVSPPRRTLPREVGLYGLGFYTWAVFEICGAAGIRVAFVVEEEPESQPGTGPGTTDVRLLREALERAQVPVWTEVEFIRRLEQKERLPVLMAARIENHPEGSVSEDPYLRNARRVREISGGSCRLLHPITLAHAFPPPASRKRIALFGFPGSGNILAQQLLQELGQRIDAPVPAAVERIAAFAEHYFASTLVLLRHLLGHLRPVEMDLTPSQFPTFDLTLTLPQDVHLLAEHIPSNRHFASYFHLTHAAPTRLAVEELTRLGATCVAIIRHPCETILSWASKQSRPPTPVLDNPAFFQETLLRLAAWHRQLLDNEDRLLVLRYEDLVAQQARPLQVVAERLGVSLATEDIKALYQRFLNRDLLPGIAPGHYYRGGSDKWQHFFLPHHVRQLRDEGFEAICERWDYDLTLPEGSARLASRTQGGPSGQKGGIMPLVSLRAMKKLLLPLKPFPLLIRSNSSEACHAIQAALQGPEFLAHLNAGGLGPESPPWIAPIPWRELAPIFHPEVSRQRQGFWSRAARRFLAAFGLVRSS